MAPPTARYCYTPNSTHRAWSAPLDQEMHHAWSCCKRVTLRRHDRICRTWLELCGMAGWTAHAEQDVFLGLLADNVRTKKADVVATDQMGIRRILDVRTIATHSPHAMELKAAQAAKRSSMQASLHKTHWQVISLNRWSLSYTAYVDPLVTRPLSSCSPSSRTCAMGSSTRGMGHGAGACGRPDKHAVTCWCMCTSVPCMLSTRLRWGMRKTDDGLLFLSPLVGGAPPEPAKPHMMILHV